MVLTANDTSSSLKEQLTDTVNRYNSIAERILVLEKESSERDSRISRLKDDMRAESEHLKSLIKEIKSIMDSTLMLKTELTKEFKGIVKEDAFTRITRRIDNKDYEKNISKAKFKELLDE